MKPKPDPRTKQFQIIAGRLRLIAKRRKSAEIKALWTEAASIIQKAAVQS